MPARKDTDPDVLTVNFDVETTKKWLRQRGHDPAKFKIASLDANQTLVFGEHRPLKDLHDWEAGGTQLKSAQEDLLALIAEAAKEAD